MFLVHIKNKSTRIERKKLKKEQKEGVQIKDGQKEKKGEDGKRIKQTLQKIKNKENTNEM